MAELKEVNPELVLALRERLLSPDTDITERSVHFEYSCTHMIFPTQL